MERSSDSRNRAILGVPKLINNHYLVTRKVGNGAFGEIYAGIDIYKVKYVAIKFEATSTKTPQLMHEAQIYAHLTGGEGIPKLHWCGTESEWNVLIIDMLGPSLEEFLNVYEPLCSLLVLHLAQQMITRIEYLHEKFLLHRDIKPENFLMGGKSKGYQLHLIDFGLVKRYRDSYGRHIPYRESKGMTGTARYASISTHLGIEQARRDDLESMAYVLIYLMRGHLPWQGLQTTVKEDKYGRILNKKLNIPVEYLCHGLPECFSTFLTYSRILKFQDRPDYNFFRNCFFEEWLRLSLEVGHTVNWKSVFPQIVENAFKENRNNLVVDSTQSGEGCNSSSSRSKEKEPNAFYSSHDVCSTTNHCKHKHKNLNADTWRYNVTVSKQCKTAAKAIKNKLLSDKVKNYDANGLGNFTFSADC